MKRIRRSFVVLIGVIMVLMSATSAFACTSLGIGKDATVDGATMVSHTCDGWYDNRIVVVPGGTHAAGDTVDILRDPCYATMEEPTKVGEVPQVAETYTYFNIAYPFMNEKQVMIAEHTWGGRDEAMNPQGLFVIANLEMLGLQRAATARDFIKTAGALAEKYGYCDGGETLIIADKTEVWVLEIAGGGTTWTADSGKPGAHWVAQRVPDDQIYVGANRARIGVVDFEDTENFMVSTDITVLPELMGWWKQGDDFNFAELFDPRSDGQFGSSRREWRVFDLLAPSLGLEVVDTPTQYPFTIKPDEKVDVKTIMDIYSDHYEGTPYDMTKGLAAGPFGNPVRWRLTREQKPENTIEKGFDWDREIAVNRCSYSFVSQSRADMPDPVGGVLWFGEDSADTTVYVPVYCGVTEVPEAWSTGDRDKFDPDSAWWAFNFVNNWATLRWDAMYAEIREKKATYEDEFFAKQAEIEAEAVKLYGESPDKAVEYLTKYTNDSMNTVADGWWDFAWHLVGKYYDGLCIEEDGSSTTLGYPKEWLEAVGYGQTSIDDYAKIHGTATAPAASQAPAPAASQAPAPAATPAPAPAEPVQNNMTAVIIVAILVVALVAVGYVVSSNSKKKK